ncbi:MAG: Kazal-type serine protease inhibitor [Hoeflea sp.]|nr:Kazal-type serine protease inhibitor [Hoeflea sp.]
MLAIAAVVLSGCEASGDNYNSGPVCPMIYDPVCAVSRGQERTFPNACEARAQGWRVVASGQCRSGNYRYDRGRDYRGRDYRDSGWDRNDRRDFERPRFDNRPGRNAPVQPPVRPQPPVYQPPVQPNAPVRPIDPVRPVAPGGACPQVIEQVCGQLGDTTQMFMNRCELQRAGATEVAAGQCMGGNR